MHIEPTQLYHRIPSLPLTIEGSIAVVNTSQLDIPDLMVMQDDEDDVGMDDEP
jgi:hypothetical protein